MDIIIETSPVRDATLAAELAALRVAVFNSEPFNLDLSTEQQVAYVQGFLGNPRSFMAIARDAATGRLIAAKTGEPLLRFYRGDGGPFREWLLSGRRDPSKVAYMLNYIDPGFLGQGISTTLRPPLMAEAVRAGYSTLVCETMTDQYGLQHLENAGWQRIPLPPVSVPWGTPGQPGMVQKSFQLLEWPLA